MAHERRKFLLTVAFLDKIFENGHEHPNSPGEHILEEHKDRIEHKIIYVVILPHMAQGRLQKTSGALLVG